jgi:hypothetical protein
MRRHVYYYTHLGDAPGETVERRFRADPGLWLPPPALPADGHWLVDVSAEGVLPSGLALQRAEVRLSDARDTGGYIVRSLSWLSARADRIFPVLEGDFELFRLPYAGWQLSLVGMYRPPLSVVGGAADKVLGQRVAEACVRRFVLDVAERLEPATLPM